MIDLSSDTQTRPTAAMRRAMAEAEVGDEQKGRDPTVNELCARVAELLGFEAAVYLPSGTMCNEIAFAVHTRRGDEAYLHRTSHPIVAEGGGPAAVSGVMMHPFDGPRGMFTAEELAAALRPPQDRYSPRSRLVSVENTTNLAGGHVWPLEQLREVVSVARDAGLALHMDGARLLNAVVASGVPAAEYTQGFDTAWLDFSKGLGAPVGACLAGSAELIEEAWRLKQMLGGAMRQAGIVAAGALYALDHHVDRLADDHALARELAAGLAGIEGVDLDPGVATNIVVFGVEDAPALVAALEAAGVRMGALGPRTMRAVTHLDVDADGVARAVKAVGEALSARVGA